MNRNSSRLALLFLAAAALLSLAPSFSPVGNAAAVEVTLFTEDFEAAFPGTAWTVGESSPTSGLDYWGTSTFRSNAGTTSAWCAQVGDQLGTPNVNLRTYDSDMVPAFMSFRTPDLTPYTTVYLQFALWLEVETGFDRLDLVAGPVGGPHTLLAWWDVNTTWTAVNVTIPGSAREVSFNFRSDGSVVYEGAYVDDVRLAGLTSDAEAPVITHTPVASAPPAQPIPISATITDNVGVASATLHYRGVGGGSFSAVPMTEQTPDTYVAQIPAQTPGTAHYFLEATDGTNTVFLPAGGLTTPYAIAVGTPDTTAPQIVHIPVGTAPVGSPIPVLATVTDNVGVDAVFVHFKAVGQTTFVPLGMTGVGSVYTATIPAQGAEGELEYYIEATDGANNVAYSPGSGPGAPNSVTIHAGGIPAVLPSLLLVVVLAAIVVVGAWGMTVIRRRNREAEPGEEPTRVESPGSERPSEPPGPVMVAKPLAPTAVGPPPSRFTAGGVCVVCAFVNETGTVFCERCGTRLSE